MVTRKQSNRLLQLAALAALPCALSSAAFAQSYTGPNGGSWDIATNWTPVGVPNNASTDASVVNGATVVIPDGVTRTVDDLTIGALSGVTVGANSYLNVSGSLINAGILTVTTGDSRLRTNGNDLSITGTGAVVLAGPSAAIDGGGFVTNGAGHTLRGYGNFGYNNTGLTNLGTVSANVSGQTLTLDPANAANSNAGLFLANNGGTLLLTGSGGGGIDNTGGIIRAEAGSTFQMVNDASVSNGTLTTTGSGAIRFSNTTRLTDVISTGNLRINNGAYLVLGSSIANNNSITFDSTGGDTRLRTNGASVNITGTGTIDMTAGGLIDGGGRITLSAGQTVFGKGGMGANNTLFTSAGLIHANVAGETLTLDPANGVDAFVNTGTLRASNGGTLLLTGGGGGGLNNTGGIIRAEAGSTFHMVSDASVVNGTMTTTGSGAIRFSNSTSLTDVTSTGNLRLNNGAYLYIVSSLINNGSITFDSTGGDTRLRTNGNPVNITGTGTIDMTAGGSIDGGSRLTLSVGQTLFGKGNLGMNATAFTSNGLIHANVAGEALVFDPANTADAFVNNGTMRASNGGRLHFTGGGGGDFVNNNLIEATGADSAVELTNSARIIGGTLTASSGGALRELDGQTVYLQNTTISANSPYTVGTNSYTVIEGSLTLNGTVDFKTADNFNQRLRTNGADVALNGTGLILLDNTLSVNTDCVIDGGGRLTIAPTITIRGSGSIGYNNTAFTNNGVIESDRGGIGIDPANTDNAFVNNNIIRALNGGLVLLTGGGGGNFVQAPNAVISATGTGVVQLTNSARVIGGTLTTTAGGTMQSNENQTVYLQDTILSTGSTFTVGKNSYTVLENSITNNGTITFTTDAATIQRLRTNGNDVAINGVGQIVLNNQIVGGSDMVIDGGGRITLGAGQTVRGSGSLGYNNTAFTNNGIVESAVGGIGIDPANTANAFLNNNIVRALNGGLIFITGAGGGDFVNTNGTFSADGTGVFQLSNSARIIGGTLTTTNGGTMQSNENQTVYLQNTTLSSGSTFTVGKNSWTTLEGSITNNGTITFKTDAATNQRLRTNGNDVSITGTGFIVLNNDSFVGSDMVIDGGGRMTFGSGQTVRGSGSMGYNNTLFTNNGVIESSVGGIGIDPANGGADSFLNNGTLRANNGGNLTFNGSGGGAFSGAGQLITNGTGSLLFTNSAQANMGAVSGTGTLSAINSSNATFTNMRVGTLTVDSSATARIAAGGGNAGTSSTSSLTLGNNARLDMTDHAMIVEYSGATVADTVRGYLASGRQNNGAWQGPGIMSSLASAANGKGVGYLESSQRFGPSGGNFYGQPADGTSVLVAYTFNGDTDLDHDVDFNDLLRVAQSYGIAANRVWFNGDFTYNGAVDFSDLLPLAQNYGQSMALTQSQQDALSDVAGMSFLTDWSTARSMVPEPATLGLLAGVTALALRRRK